MRTMRTKARPRSGATIAEFGPALFLFFFILFPLMNLVGYAWCVATATLIAHDCARAASESSDYPAALSAMQNRVQQDLASGFGTFAHLAPFGGYANCGADLYVTVTDVNTQASVTYGPNSPVPPPIDATKNIYEYQVKTLFDVKPCLNLAGLPFIGSTPMIGHSSRLNTVAFRAVEMPQGLAMGSGSSLTGTIGSGAPIAGDPIVPSGGNDDPVYAPGQWSPPPGWGNQPVAGAGSPVPIGGHDLGGGVPGQGTGGGVHRVGGPIGPGSGSPSAAPVPAAGNPNAIHQAHPGGL